MTGGKDEEKLMGPLFPRLHINQAEKGGPRAPPRNKMALYEQLSIPSRRFTSGSASILPLPPTNSGLVPSTSSIHGGGQSRSLCAPFCNSPPASSSGWMNLNTTSRILEWRPAKLRKYHTSKVAGHLSMTANSSFSQPQSLCNSKNSSVNKLGDEGDCRVPTFVQSWRTLNNDNGQQNMDKEKITTSSPHRQLQTVCVKQLKQTYTADLVSRQHMRNQTEENSKTSPSCQDCAKKPASILTNGDKLSVDASSSPPAKRRISELLKSALVSLNEEKRSSLVDDCDYNAQLLQQYRASQEKKALRDGISAEPKKAVRKGNASTVEGVSCSRPLPGENHRCPNKLENVSECHEDQCWSLEVRKVDGNADISDTSTVDSMSGGVDISPDDVVGAIGCKQFWKARRVIIHQQRVFALQVFELHRLIKVQRLFAASPDLFLKNKLFLGKPSIEVFPVQSLLPSKNVPEAPPLIAKIKEDPQRPNSNTECRAGNALGKPPLPSLNGDTNKGLDTLQSNYKPYSANSPPASRATDAKSTPLRFHPPPGNQWLVPVMSPSEGLIYKPYSGPCPPTADFMAPVYGSSSGPMNLTRVGGDFLNAAYGIPASQHQQGIGMLSGTPRHGLTYFSPYGMPSMNPSVPSSAVEQASKESELQASTASSPKRVKGDAPSLFPTAPTIQVFDHPFQIHGVEQRARVIKVVPHNPMSASESAARIFRSIQEERRHSD